ncbi:MAG: glutathione S-transferase N-terminal domain-containing protein [Proteobacteria bacterium]|nr:glutathione S-transferase N-terminal domain-containing protein [Pseudomonadota bacterium]MDA1356357.1 glutathione S-transferase N-terminal domain-containing protein [Pseudomonadota bacterium]
MKLYNAPTSPFGRKAAIVAREHGIKLDEETTNPFESDQLARINPLKLIPVLVLDDGAVLLESHLICEYLDSIGTGPTLYPEANRWLWRTRMMIGHGLAEASVQLRLQQVLPDGEQSATLKTRYAERMARAVAALDGQADALAEGEMRMDKICAVMGIGHMEFRHGGDWRGDAPNLAAWYDDAMARPSFAATDPN